MLSYSKPTVIECGTSESVIQGQCGWGFENVTLDKTGATKNKALKLTYKTTCGDKICIKCHIVRNRCSTEIDNC